MRNCLRQIDFSIVILQFAWGFLLSTVKTLICLRQLDADLSDSSVRLRLFLVSGIEVIRFLKRWSVDELIFLSAWGFFSYHILKGYISWSDGASTNWFFCPPKAFSRITYWRDTFLEAMERRRVDSSVRLRLFLVSHIEEIHFLKRCFVDELVPLSAWGFFYITY